MPVTGYNEYSPIGDVLVLAISLVFFILIRAAYINKQKNYMILFRIIVMLPIASICNILFYLLMKHVGEVDNLFIYLTRIGYHVSLFGMLVLYVMYTVEMARFRDGRGNRYLIAAYAGYAVLFLYEILGIFLKFGFYIDEQGGVHSGFPFLAVGYIYFIVIALCVLVRGGDKIYGQVIRGVIGCALVSFTVMLIQGFHGQRSFTTASFVFPVFALLYLVHANPYDISIGSIGADSLRDQLKYCHEKNRVRFLMSLYLPEFDRTGSKYPEFIQKTIREFSSQFFKDTILFEVGDGHLILSIDTGRNPDYIASGQKMIDAFYETYNNYGFDYKIVSVVTGLKEEEKLDYINLIQYVQNRMPVNTIKAVGENEIKLFREHQYIVSELADIASKKDPDDPRILAYCQPVFDTVSGCYDTAEALMRLKLPRLGMVFPDRFIPIAEKYGYIQAISQIILAKVCKEVKTLLDDGYHFVRISVNMSAIDLREKDFSENIISTISSADIPADFIAIEITESQNESEFNLAKSKMDELQNCGIKFYLDDFGTGYSNFERIMELPFDIIKFDRSLTIASGEQAKSRTMISHLANMFSDVGYAILYEGVEDDAEEKRCMGMRARYLQGYKYSRPIPIEQLTDFFIKEDEYQKSKVQLISAGNMAR